MTAQVSNSGKILYFKITWYYEWTIADGITSGPVAYIFNEMAYTVLL